MDDILQTEEEFDISGLIFYCLKRWLIITFAAIFGAALFLAMFILKDTYIDDNFGGGARFYTITEFLHDNSALISTDSPYAEAVYNLTASRVMENMSSDKVKDVFIKDPAVLAEMRIIFDKPQRNSEYNFKQEFSEHFSVTNNTHNFFVGIKARLDSEIKKESAVKLLDKYIDCAVLYAREKINDANIPYNAIEKIEPIEKLSEKKSEGSIIKNLITGIAVGAAAGIAVVLLIFFIDPRVKSFNQIKPYVNNLIAKVKDSEPEHEPALNIAARIKDDKTVLFASEKGGVVFVSALAKTVAAECAAAGFKTLIIDFNDAEKSGTALDDYLENKTAPQSCAEGYDVFTVVDASGWSKLLNKKSEFEKLGAKYDKIIFAYCDIYSGGAVVLSDLADKAVLAVNQKTARLKDVKALLGDFEKQGMCVGAYIYNAI